MRRAVAFLFVILLLHAQMVSAVNAEVTVTLKWNADVPVIPPKWDIPDFKYYQLNVSTGDDYLLLRYRARLIPPEYSAYISDPQIDTSGLPEGADEVIETYARLADSVYELAMNLAIFTHEYLNYNPKYLTNDISMEEAWERREGICRHYVLVERALLGAAGIDSLYAKGIMTDVRGGHMAMFVHDSGKSLDGRNVDQYIFVDPTNFMYGYYPESILSSELWVDVDDWYSVSVAIPSDVSDLSETGKEFSEIEHYYTKYRVKIGDKEFDAYFSPYGGVLVMDRDLGSELASDFNLDIPYYLQYFPANMIVVPDGRVVAEASYANGGTIEIHVEKVYDGILVEAPYPVAFLDEEGKLIPYVPLSEDEFLYRTNSTILYLNSEDYITVSEQGGNETLEVPFNYTILAVFPRVDDFMYVVEINSLRPDVVLNQLSEYVSEYEFKSNETVIVDISVPAVNYQIRIPSGDIVLRPDNVTANVTVKSVALLDGRVSVLLSVPESLRDYFVSNGFIMVENSIYSVTTRLVGNLVELTFEPGDEFSVVNNPDVLYGAPFKLFPTNVQTKVIDKKFYADYVGDSFKYRVTATIRVEGIQADTETLSEFLPGVDVQVKNQNVLTVTKTITTDKPTNLISTTIKVFGTPVDVRVDLTSPDITLVGVYVESYRIDEKNKTVDIGLILIPMGNDRFSARYVAKYLESIGSIEINDFYAEVIDRQVDDGVKVHLLVRAPLENVMKSTELRVFGAKVKNDVEYYIRNDYIAPAIIVQGIPTIGTIKSNVPYTVEVEGNSVVVRFKVDSVYDTIEASLGEKNFTITPTKPAIKIQFENYDTIDNFKAPGQLYSGYRNLNVRITGSHGPFKVYLDGEYLGEFEDSMEFKLPKLPPGKHVIEMYDGSIKVFRYEFEVIEEPLSVTIQRYAYYLIAFVVLFVAIIVYYLVSSERDPVTYITKKYPSYEIVYYKKRKNKVYIIARSVYDGSEYLFKFVNGKLVAKKRRMTYQNYYSVQYR